MEALPEPGPIIEHLQGTKLASETERLACAVLDHRVPVMGYTIETGAEIDWRRDYVHGFTTPLRYFRFIPYLDFRRVGDHKVIWELNRHQHLVLLAQAFRLTERREFIEELVQQIDSWLSTNRFMYGINWVSALEVAFRAISWIWVYHLAGEFIEDRFRKRLLVELYRHGCYLENNLSFYFSPNTHLLGEAVALHALGALFPTFPRAERWTRLGARVVEQQMERQIQEDGSHFEQSSYYHLYALDMFLLHRVLAGTSARLDDKLKRMAHYLAALQGEAALLPMIGDDDGGRLFHPYGSRREFGRATLATCGVLFENPRWVHGAETLHEQAVWWLGPQPPERRSENVIGSPESRLFTKSGLAVMNASDRQIIMDVGPFGAGSAGHSHSDTLSVVVRRGTEEILIDPGTYTYVADPQLRDWFRGSAAHNTIRINARDQARPAGPFRWEEKPVATVRKWKTSPELDFLDAECRFAGFSHRRRLVFRKPDLCLVLDEIDGPAGQHQIEQFWHFGETACQVEPGGIRIGSETVLMVAGEDHVELLEDAEHGWRSPVFGSRHPAPVLRVHRATPLPTCFWTVLDFAGSTGSLQIVDRQTCRFRRQGSEIDLRDLIPEN